LRYEKILASSLFGNMKIGVPFVIAEEDGEAVDDAETCTDDPEDESAEITIGVATEDDGDPLVEGDSPTTEGAVVDSIRFRLFCFSFDEIKAKKQRTNAEIFARFSDIMVIVRISGEKS